MKYLAILLFLQLINFSSISQSAEITFIHYSDTSDEGMDRDIEFPTIQTGSYAIDSVLSRNIRRDILFDTLTTPINNVLSSFVSGASYLSLNSNITYNNKNIISIFISCEFCGASCDYYEEALVYSLKTGNRLFISDVLDSSLFLNKVLKMDIKEQYQKSVNAVLAMKDSCGNCTEFDTDNFDFFLEKLQQAKNSFSNTSFCLYEDSVTILDECPFSRINSHMCPETEFSYNYTDIINYLKIEL